ncbi:serine/threonine-protein kinase [Prosthecobacter sp.]|uniref:serine/threonine-protein kinase n=1 Tax=Prosthecobacter sp. TaxID=1965333 RepID=UPI0037853089
MNPITCQTCGKPLPDDAPQGICPACLLERTLKDHDAAPQPPELELQQLATLFPQLVIEELIGQGGMGRVYRAQQPHLNRVVALKVLSAERMKDPEWLERFSREARALARLSHPHIVQVYDFGETPLPYLLMEHVEGVNLRQAMQNGGLTAREALAIVPKLCDALHYAHEHGVLHRDIKPENILIDTEGRVKLVDFGLAKLRDEGALHFTLTQSGSKLGTLAYMAPEQVEKPAEVDHRADIYSLGVVLYEMLTGELPLGRFPAPSEASGVDARLDGVVMRTLEKHKDRRFQSAEEMKSGIEDAANGKALPPAAQPRRKWTRYALAAVIVSMIAVPWYLFTSRWLAAAEQERELQRKRVEREQTMARYEREAAERKKVFGMRDDWVARASQADSKLNQEVVLQEIAQAMKSEDKSTVRSAALAVQGLYQLDFDRSRFREPLRAHLESADPLVRYAALAALMTCKPDDSDRQRVLNHIPKCEEIELQGIASALQVISNSDFTGEYSKPMLAVLERGMAAAQRPGPYADGRPYDSRGVLGAIWGSKVSPEIEARLIVWSYPTKATGGVMSAGNSDISYNTFYHALSVQANKSRAAVKRILELAYHPDTTNIAGRCLWGLQGSVPDKSDQAYTATEVIKLLGLRSDDYMWRMGLNVLERFSGSEHLQALEALASREALAKARKDSLQKIIAQIRSKP